MHFACGALEGVDVDAHVLERDAVADREMGVTAGNGPAATVTPASRHSPAIAAKCGPASRRYIAGDMNKPLLLPAESSFRITASAPVRWKQHSLADLDPSRAFVLRFHLKDADLFAFELMGRER